MDIATFIGRFEEQEDVDLKYMALKEDFIIASERDMQELVLRVTLPVLVHNPSLSWLVETDVYPRMIAYGECQLAGSSWFDQWIIRPLLSLRDSLGVHTVYRIMQNVSQSGIVKVRLEDDTTFKIVLSLAKAKNAKSHIHNDLLALIVETYYDYTKTGQPFHPTFFHDVLVLCDSRHSKDMSRVLASLIKVSPELLLQQNFSTICSCSNWALNELSRGWHKFRLIVRQLFTQRLLDKEKLHPELLETLRNLEIYYTQPCVDEESMPTQPMLPFLEEITANLHYLLRKYPSKQIAILESPEIESEIEDYNDNIDEGQEKYLMQLEGTSSETEFIMEEDELDEDTSTSDYHNAIVDFTSRLQMLKERLDQELSLYTNVESMNLNNWHLTPMQESIARGLQNDGYNTVKTLTAADLPSEVAICLLINVLKPDKAYYKIIKIGNMKETMDEGAESRINAYNILLAKSIPYLPSCQILSTIIKTCIIKEVLYNKEAHIIIDLMVRLIERILNTHYNTIRAINGEWYSGVLLDSFAKMRSKWALFIKNRFNQGEAQSSSGKPITSQQLLEAHKLEDSMNRLFHIFQHDAMLK